MTPEKLLLRDLCARLPYEPFAQWHHKVLNEFRDVKIMKISTYGKNIDDYHINVLCQPEPGVDYEASIVDIKPYLRPMSSMTGEEKQYIDNRWGADNYGDIITYSSYEGGMSTVELADIIGFQDWLNANHFDYRGLIEKGLALPAPEGMYNEK